MHKHGKPNGDLNLQYRVASARTHALQLLWPVAKWQARLLFDFATVDAL
jgi:hypothetical protein